VYTGVNIYHASFMFTSSYTTFYTDPDCASPTAQCTNFEAIGPFQYSFTRAALPSGVCLYCPVPETNIVSSPYKNNTLVALSGQTLLRCPYTFSCPSGTVCNSGTGLCVAANSSGASIPKLLCAKIDDCESFQMCGAGGYCTSIGKNTSSMTIDSSVGIPSESAACAGS
jgi:hypothetical protein